MAKKYNLNRTVVWYIIRLIERHGTKIVYRSRNKKYSKEFKKAAIDRVLLNGETYVRVSIELGLSNVGLLHSWIKSFLENGYNVVEKKRGRKPYEQKARKQDEHLIEARKWTFTKAEFTPYHRERILKKIRCLSSEKRKPTKEEIAQAITELRQELLCSLRFILEVINSNPNCPGISRSDYYYHLKKVSKDLKNKEIMSLITEIYYHHKKRYGYRRITLELANRGILINHKKVKRLMKLMGLFALTPKAKYRSYKGDLNGVVKSHLLIKIQDQVAHKTYYQRDFSTTSCNQKWTTDVTEFRITNSKVYLSPIMDMHNREIIAFNISTSPNFQQTVKMIGEAFQKFEDLSGLILHSDQGWQYQMRQYRQMLAEKNIIQSMSRKGNCLDNSPMENFFGKLKNEMFYGHESEFKTVEELIQAITNYIHYYNNERIQVKLKGLTPVQYRHQSL
ncbi:IS3 family transposase [Ureaplasma diversum]|uniref:IS3 family transposase n=1 Tax=Ureaplasma diversum TaxID=42094 RepID=UPI0038CD5705